LIGLKDPVELRPENVSVCPMRLKNERLYVPKSGAGNDFGVCKRHENLDALKAQDVRDILGDFSEFFKCLKLLRF
jgi:hypothetical protein